MGNQTKTRTTILDYIKDTMKTVFESKEEIVVNNIDEIIDWEQCKKEKDTAKFSDEDRKEIENIMKLEKNLEMKKNQVRGIKENLKTQIESRESRPNMKFRVEKEERQK